MKRRIDRYKCSRRLMQLILIAVALGGVGSIDKSIYMKKKISLIKCGIDYYEKAQWIEAETYLSEASSYDFFSYEEAKLQKLLVDLNWITQYQVNLFQ